MSDLGVVAVCGKGWAPVELPDTGEPCCYGSANDGPQGCTCWEPIYDLEQQPPDSASPGVRSTPCVDCAYRPRSPERSGADGYAGDADMLDSIVVRGEPFYCHQGIRRPVRYRHPTGVEIDGHPADYSPPIVGRVPFKADGTPADLCAGWTARRLHQLMKPTRTAEETP